ncbi:hypothetical protein GCM10027418_30460 [Mariniluteicoccus endophyticus]
MTDNRGAQRPTANVYIDGFNLYRRLLEDHPEAKWLDLEVLSERLLPEYRINRVRYFTAHIKALPGADAQSPQRQQAYLRALATLPRTTIHLGNFRIDRRLMQCHPTEWLPDGTPKTVKVKKIEEKGSDVALASYLLLDAHRDDAHLYAVLTNDSDLVTPLHMVRHDLNRDTALISPMEPKRASNQLKQTQPTIRRQVTLADTVACQLPDEVQDAKGTIRRPLAWKNSEGPADDEAL